MKPGVMKQVVSAVHALKCREGVSRVDLDLFLQQKFGGRSPRESKEALERAVTEGFVQFKNNKYFPRASGLPAELPAPVPVRTRSTKRAPTNVRTTRSATGRVGKRRGGGRKRGEVQETTASRRRERRSKVRRKRRRGRRHLSKDAGKQELEGNQNVEGQEEVNEEDEEEVEEV